MVKNSTTEKKTLATELIDFNLTCIIHEDFEKSSKALLGSQFRDMAKKQSVF